MGKDLGRGPTDPSPHVGGASAPNDWGIKGIPPLFHDPLWGWVGFCPLVIGSTSLDLGARIRLTSHEGRSFTVRSF